MKMTLAQATLLLNHYGIVLTVEDLQASQNAAPHRYMHPVATQFPQHSLLLDTLRYVTTCEDKKIVAGDRQVGFMIQPAGDHGLVFMILHCRQIDKAILETIKDRLAVLSAESASQAQDAMSSADKMVKQALQNTEIHSLLQRLYGSVECVLLGLDPGLALDKIITQQLAHLMRVAYHAVSVNFIPVPSRNNLIFLEDVLRVFLSNAFNPQSIQSEIVKKRDLPEYQLAQLEEKFKKILLEHQVPASHVSTHHNPQLRRSLEERLQAFSGARDVYDTLFIAYKYQQLINAFVQLGVDSTDFKTYQAGKVKAYDLKRLSVTELAQGLSKQLQEKLAVMVFDESALSELKEVNQQLLKQLRAFEKTKVVGLVSSQEPITARLKRAAIALPAHIYATSLAPLTSMVMSVLAHSMHTNLLQFPVYQCVMAWLFSATHALVQPLSYALVYALTVSSRLSQSFSDRMIQLASQMTAKLVLQIFSAGLGFLLTYCLGLNNFIRTAVFLLCHHHAHQYGYQPRFDDESALVNPAKFAWLKQQHLGRLIGFGFAFTELLCTGNRGQMLVFLGALISSIVAVECMHPAVPQNAEEATIVLFASLGGQQLGYSIMFFLLSIYQGIQDKLVQQQVFQSHINQLVLSNEIDGVTVQFYSPYNPLNFFSASHPVTLQYRNRTTAAFHQVYCTLSDTEPYCEGKIVEVVGENFRLDTQPSV